MTDDRRYAVVLYGATGFTGNLTAAYLTEHAPTGTAWAIAGRTKHKLEQLQRKLAQDHPEGTQPDIVVADSSDRNALDALAAQTKVVATTVGPYLKYGEPLVAACAKHGTDYADLTGEPEFVDRMWLDHHETATKSGARIVHACGFDSIPHDLGALHCADQLPKDGPLKIRGFVRASGVFSGGTYHTAITQFSRARTMQRVHAERRNTEKARDTTGGTNRVRTEAGLPYRERAVDAWAFPFPTVDPQIVGASARALPDRYGPDFTYGHYVAIKRLPIAIGAATGLGAVFLLAQLGPTRDLLLKLKDPGTGPSPQQMERARFSVRFVGEAGGRRVVTEVSGGDPGYGETSKMLAESALCLALDDLPQTAGQVTTAAAMGDALTRRLQDAGIAFRVLEPAPQ